MYDINLRGRKSDRRRRNIYTKLAIIVLIIITFILIKATWNVYIKNRETKENLTETESKLEDLKKRESDLSEEIESLNTERGIDREIRTKFRVTKEGEGMILLIDSPRSTASSTSSDKGDLWSRILDLF